MSALTRKEALTPVGRWTHAKKYWLLHAVREGCLTDVEAKVAHGISEEEWSRWVHSLEAFGVQALRTTFGQKYRMAAKRAGSV